MGAYQHTENLSPQALAQFSVIIDVRSPGEYAEDHLPGAINLPVLDDAERAEIGTIYKQVSTFEARRLGAAKVSRNIARHLDGALKDYPRDVRPLIYCWRGGMRSRSMALVLQDVGWQSSVVKGGYRLWRKEVTAALSNDDHDLFQMIVLDGQTGSAKTQVLQAIEKKGAQVLDLEDLAAHRGSIFGDHPDLLQPSQKRFESLLWESLRNFDPSVPVFVEAESSRLGNRTIPVRVWNSMKAAPTIALSLPAEVRARHLLATYPDIAANGPRLQAAIDGLAQFHPRADVDQWRMWAEAGAFEPLAVALIRSHYDPAYDRARARHDQPLAANVDADRLDADAIEQLAERVLIEAKRVIRI
ncbi:MAG: tRNA 2-selenouridine(34) synthase MnmH [Maricaulis sp.]|nr:tRNA 2-selenouridine(34) synthase MnmH [Maricaulis sp.]HAQ34248.1 tRNA 2-selenouridine(34) synthase MnmH [Alphaproteobacteria bacterium]